jgi:hypothetical protein
VRELRQDKRREEKYKISYLTKIILIYKIELELAWEK